MSSTKTCPSCQAQVPLSAFRCKACFHDFAASKGSYGPLLVLGSVTFMTMVAAIGFFISAQQPTDQAIFVDQDTRSVVITTQYRSGPSTDRIKFDEITKLEHVAHSSGGYSIVAVTGDGRTEISTSEHPMYAEGDRFAAMMGKPIELVGIVGAEKPPEKH